MKLNYGFRDLFTLLECPLILPSFGAVDNIVTPRLSFLGAVPGVDNCERSIVIIQSLKYEN